MMFLVLCTLLFSNVHLTVADDAALIEEGVKTYNDMVIGLKDGIKQLLLTEEQTYIATTLSKLKSHMGQQQKDALNVISQINKDAIAAIDASRTVIFKLKNICENVIHRLNQNRGDTNLKMSVRDFLDEGKTLEDDVKNTIQKLIVVRTKSQVVDSKLNNLKGWASTKRNQLIAKSRAEIAAERAKAYAAAAACLAWGPFAIFTCPTAYAIAAGITEGNTIKNIENAFNREIQQVERIRSQISIVGTKTGQLIERVEKDETKMIGIQTKLQSANGKGRLTLRISAPMFYNRFKDAVTLLYNACSGRLSARR